MTPFDGLAFLISAITAAWPALILLRILPIKSRGFCAANASCCIKINGFSAMAERTSDCFTLSILFKISDIVLSLLVSLKAIDIGALGNSTNQQHGDLVGHGASSAPRHLYHSTHTA